MAKRSRANRTEKATYQNIRNEHKYIDVRQKSEKERDAKYG